MKTVQRGVNRIIGNGPQLKHVARRPKFTLLEARNRNDHIILISTTGGDVKQLVREGDEVCGCDCAKLGVIQRVDVGPTSGSYVVLAALVGAPAVNQRVLTGNAHAGNDNEQTDPAASFLETAQGHLLPSAGGRDHHHPESASLRDHRPDWARSSTTMARSPSASSSTIPPSR